MKWIRRLITVERDIEKKGETNSLMAITMLEMIIGTFVLIILVVVIVIVKRSEPTGWYACFVDLYIDIFSRDHQRLTSFVVRKKLLDISRFCFTDTQIQIFRQWIRYQIYSSFSDRFLLCRQNHSHQ